MGRLRNLLSLTLPLAITPLVSACDDGTSEQGDDPMPHVDGTDTGLETTIVPTNVEPPEMSLVEPSQGETGSEDTATTMLTEDPSTDSESGETGNDPVCGNGTVEGDEQCDDGNQFEDDACNNRCQYTHCGDGIVQESDGEQCDDGNEIENDGCTNACTHPRCGDGIEQAEAGEQCDDGNQIDDDACTNACTAPVCGDGIVQASSGERCDDGNQVDNDDCTNACALASCGDGVLQPAQGEACDDGNDIDNDACTNACTVPVCGDGITQPGLNEACDDGNDVDDDRCTNACEPTHCGDGIVQANGGEQCDDGNNVGDDTCTNGCQLPVCGDGIVQASAGEQCDDINTVDDDLCSNDCQKARCGDGIVQPRAGEGCDDANDIDDDACSNICRSPTCGDGIVQSHLNETCDDGNAINDDACSNACAPAICGDGIAQVEANGESCDDANEDDTDDCTRTCKRPERIWMGRYGVCARYRTKLYCWGEMIADYLEQPGVGSVGDDEKPGDVLEGVTPPGGWTDLDVTTDRACLVTKSGGVRCFGDGFGGKLGYGNQDSIGDDEDPFSAGDVWIDGKVVQIAVAQYHNCARTEAGTVHCWGRPDFGRLGYASLDPVGDVPLSAAIPAVQLPGPAIDIDVAEQHSCAVIEGGNLVCWGRNEDRQLGYTGIGFVGDNEHPSELGYVELDAPIKKVATQGFRTCVIYETGDVKCWGRSSGGTILGYPNTGWHHSVDVSPGDVGLVDVGGAVTQLAMGYRHTCALLATGAVRCWGGSSGGELGYGYRHSVGWKDTPASAGDVPIGGPVAEIAVGHITSCARLVDGGIRCWGQPGRGSLGSGSDDNFGDHPSTTPDKLDNVQYWWKTEPPHSTTYSQTHN